MPGSRVTYSLVHVSWAPSMHDSGVSSCAHLKRFLCCAGHRAFTATENSPSIFRVLLEGSESNSQGHKSQANAAEAVAQLAA